MKHSPHNCKGRLGFSLVEVLIGMTVLMIAIAGAFYLSINLARQHQGVQYLAAAASLAEYKLEELRNAEFADITSGADDSTLDDLGQSPGLYTRAWAVVDDTPADGLKTVTVTVSWDQWGVTREYKLAGVIGPWGGVVAP